MRKTFILGFAIIFPESAYASDMTGLFSVLFFTCAAIPSATICAVLSIYGAFSNHYYASFARARVHAVAFFVAPSFGALLAVAELNQHRNLTDVLLLYGAIALASLAPLAIYKLKSRPQRA